MSGSTTLSKVSVILPTYNGGRFIARAIKSVLAQAYSDFELLIIDDGSTDNTSTVVSPFLAQDSRIHYIRNERNLGLQKTLNVGLKMAQGGYIARIDDDDQWIAPDKLSQQVRFLDGRSDYVLVGTGVVVVDEQERELFRFMNPETDRQIRRKMLYRNCFSHSAVMFRRASVLALGGYGESEGALHVEDYDLWLRLGTAGKVGNLPIYGVSFTSRQQAISASNRAMQFRRVIGLIRNHRHNYPGYYRGLTVAYARYFLYSVFNKLPARVRYMLLRFYKQS